MEDAGPHDFHDRSYRYLLSNLRLFQELVEGFVDEPWVAELDFGRAERVDKTFVLESYLEKESDILYKVPFGDDSLYIYVLVEHQSTVDHAMAFRVMVYIVEIWKDYFSNLEEKERGRADFRLPAIFPIVLYNGQPNWTAPTRLKDTISGAEMFGPQIPDFEYWLVDASHCDWDRLRQLRNAIAAVFAMEHRPPKPAEFRAVLEEALGFVLEDQDETVWRTMWVWFRNWLTRNLGKEVSSDVLANMDPNAFNGGKQTMAPALLEAFAETLKVERKEGREEGREEGRLIGEIQACERFLKRPVSAESALQEMSTDELKELARRLEAEVDARG